MKISPRIQHFIVLACILLGSAGVFYMFRTNHENQLAFGVLASISYICWGIIHHVLEKDLHMKIVVEYAVMGAIAIGLLFVVLGR